MTLTPSVPWPIPLLVGLAWAVQVTTGFGATILVLILGSPWWSVEQILPVAILVNFPATLWTVWRHKDEVDRPLFQRGIMPWMVVGGALGFMVAPHVVGDAFRRAFGAFVALQALWTLVTEARGGPRHLLAVQGARFRGWVIASGFTQALFGAGGPPLVHATNHLGLHRSVLRSTLSAVWLVSNVVLVTVFVARGRIDREVLSHVGWVLPAVPVGIALGEKLHPWLPEAAFRLLVQGVLLLGGLALLR